MKKHKQIELKEPKQTKNIKHERQNRNKFRNRNKEKT